MNEPSRTSLNIRILSAELFVLCVRHTSNLSLRCYSPLRPTRQPDSPRPRHPAMTLNSNLLVLKFCSLQTGAIGIKNPLPCANEPSMKSLIYSSFEKTLLNDFHPSLSPGRTLCSPMSCTEFSNSRYSCPGGN